MQLMAAGSPSQPFPNRGHYVNYVNHVNLSPIVANARRSYKIGFIHIVLTTQSLQRGRFHVLKIKIKENVHPFNIGYGLCTISQEVNAKIIASYRISHENITFFWVPLFLEQRSAF